MGHRINYVIKRGDKFTIYDDRWGALDIASDLYLGETAFLASLDGSPIVEHLRVHLMMEGFVLVDMQNKLLGFWAWEFENETSVIRYYISELQKIWPGWQIIHMDNEMYDAEPLLGIDYVSQQTPQTFQSVDTADIINDPLFEEIPYVLFIIRQHEEVFVAELNDILLEAIICYGEDIIALLKAKPAIPLPQEGQTRAPDHIFIDADNKQLIVNHSLLGIWETMGHKWPGYTFKMGRKGYLAMLEEAGIPTAGLEMPLKEVQERFAQMIAPRQYD